MKLLAITSCPNGIAHTYMAAENLEKAAKKMEVSMKVETQGGVGAENVLTSEEIKEADGIIIAADNTIDLSRFIGKKVLITNVQSGIHKGEELIKRFEEDTVSVYEGNGENIQSNDTRGQHVIYKHLMAGVSRMIPFIVVGGIFIALALGIGSTLVESEDGGYEWIRRNEFWQHIYHLGGAGFTFMVPALAGFIAFSIADKPGITPGFIGGWIAVNGHFYGSEADAGFLGGIIAGFLAGYTVVLIKKIPVHDLIKPIMPIIIIPLLSVLIVGFVFIFVIGYPIAWLFSEMTAWLDGMDGAATIVIAAILGAMIAIDMGGPINKVAFMFSAAMIVEGNLAFMGMTAAAIATPPLGMGLATLLAKNKYSKEEKDAGKAAIAMGFFGITEGAIPFAANDPGRVIPANIAGSVVAAVFAGLLTVQNVAPHGGPIVGVIGAVQGIGILWYFIAIILGTVTTAFVANSLKKPVTN